jgi:hypothetical protein
MRSLLQRSNLLSTATKHSRCHFAVIRINSSVRLFERQHPKFDDYEEDSDWKVDKTQIGLSEAVIKSSSAALGKLLHELVPADTQQINFLTAYLLDDVSNREFPSWLEHRVLCEACFFERPYLADTSWLENIYLSQWVTVEDRGDRAGFTEYRLFTDRQNRISP